MKPKVSIITGVYNAENYIRETIDSVLSQTLENFEWIVIDDGSKDKTTDILKGFSDGRIKLVQQTNMGLTATLNSCLKLSTGNYIARIDADDLWEKTKLQKQVDFLEKYPEYSMIATNYEQISESGDRLGRRHCPHIGDHEQICKAFIRFNPFAHSSVMFRKNVYEEIGGYNPDFKYTQDYEYWIRIASNYKLCSLEEVLTYHRLSYQSISFSKLRAQRTYALRAKFLAYKTFKYSLVELRYLIKDSIIANIPQIIVKLIKRL